MDKAMKIILLALFAATPAIAEDGAVLFNIRKITPTDDVKWIDETPLRPESYIGQLFLIDKSNNSSPYFASIQVPVLVEEEPSIKKSILIKSTKDGSVSFLDMFKVSGMKETVYQFQIVNSKKWSANTSSPDYLKSIAAFRNDPMTAPIFESPDIAGIVMVTGVVQKKIWYKVFKKEGWGGSGTYFVKVDGSNYTSSDEYEETVKYGLLLRAISWGNTFALPKLITNLYQIRNIAENAHLPKGVNDSVVKSVSSAIRGIE